MFMINSYIFKYPKKEIIILKDLFVKSGRWMDRTHLKSLRKERIFWSALPGPRPPLSASSSRGGLSPPARASPHPPPARPAPRRRARFPLPG